MDESEIRLKRIMDKPRKVEEVGFPKRMKMLKIGFMRGRWKRWNPRKLRQLGSVWMNLGKFGKNGT
jgi:hypothetical protein